MRDWFEKLDEIDRDCVLKYESLLGRRLKNVDEYREIDEQVDEMILEWDNRKAFFEAYPDLKKYANPHVLDRIDKVKFEYLVVLRTDEGTRYLPSKSRNAVKHLEDNKAIGCWVYDKDGYWVSFSELDRETGKARRSQMFPDGEPRARYARLLEVFNDKNACLCELEKLKANAEYFLGSGNGNTRLLECSDIKEHFALMKSLWLGLKEKNRPQDLSWEKILKLENRVLNERKPSLADVIEVAGDRSKTDSTGEVKKQRTEYEL